MPNLRPIAYVIQIIAAIGSIMALRSLLSANSETEALRAMLGLLVFVGITLLVLFFDRPKQ